MFSMLDLAPEEMIILLVGDLDRDLVTVGDDSLLALSPLHLSAVSGAAHSAHGASSGRAGVLDVGDQVLLLWDGQVGLCRYLLLSNLVHQITVLPGLVSAVLVTGKDLLSLGIDLPLGVTDLLGDLFALRHLLDLPQGLESVSDAFLGCEGLHFSLVTPDSLDSPLSCRCSQPPWCTRCWAG